jgi:hypothetical protein
MDIDFSRRNVEKERNTFHLKDITKPSKSTFKYVWYVPSQYIDTKRLCAFSLLGVCPKSRKYSIQGAN